jgi:hypothetical protein
MTSTELNAVDEMRQLARQTVALARAAASMLDDVVPVDDDSRVRLEDLAHVLGVTAGAADATFKASVQLEMDARAIHLGGE